MTHHEGEMSKKGAKSAAEIQEDINKPYAEDKFSEMEKGKARESSEMIQKQRAFEEGRGHDVARSTMTTGQGGPEAERSSKDMSRGSTSQGQGMPEYESEMKKKGQELQEARKREKEAGAHMLETGQGGPEAEEKRTMQTEAPTTLRASKGGYAESGSKGSETIKRSREQK